MARWSSGQDGGLSRPNREFDSPTGHHLSLLLFGMPETAFKFSFHQRYASLAQLVEHLTLNQGVQGSNP